MIPESKSALTLAVLALLLVLGVRPGAGRGDEAAARPRSTPPICVDTPSRPASKVYPQDVTVSVYNASTA